MTWRAGGSRRGIPAHGPRLRVSLDPRWRELAHHANRSQEPAPDAVRHDVPPQTPRSGREDDKRLIELNPRDLLKTPELPLSPKVLESDTQE